MQALITIDRCEQTYSRRYQIWKPLWWKERVLQPPPTNGRTVYLLDGESQVCKPLFDVPQCLDAEMYKTSLQNQPWHRRVVTRGLRSITAISDGYVISDVLGVYEIDTKGALRRYLTLPIFTDLHSALPNADNSRLLITSTGVEEVQEIGWDGTVYRRIPMPEVFGISAHKELIELKEQYPDHRLLPVEMKRHLFHVNWAQWLEEGERMLVSLYVPGMVAILRRVGEAQWETERRWTYFPKCHHPAIDLERGTIAVAISGTDQAVEVDMETGKILWIADNIRFGKSVALLDRKRALVGDCNGRRVVEIDRDTGLERWSLKLPGIPYSIEPLAPSGVPSGIESLSLADSARNAEPLLK